MIIDKRNLEILEMAGRQYLSDRLLRDGETPPTVFVNRAVGGIFVEMRWKLWSEHVGTKTMQAPFDWWQHVKERWAPEWWLRRWPVRYRIHTVSFDAVFPEYRAASPDHGKTIKMGVLKSTEP